MTVARLIRGRRVVAPCAAELDSLADDVLEMFDRLAQEVGPPPDFARQRWAWSVITLAPDSEGGLILQEPDFDGDPMTEIRPHLDVTLTVVRDQGQLCRLMRVTPVDCWFDAWVTFAPGAARDGRQRLIRHPAIGPSDSGWSVVGPREASPSEPDRGQMHRAWELLRLLPPALPALALPPDWSVIVANDRIEGIHRPGGAVAPG